jgi:hypothetical protein
LSFFAVVFWAPFVDWQFVALVSLNSLSDVGSGQFDDEDFLVFVNFMLVIHDKLEGIREDFSQGDNWLDCISRSDVLPIFFVILLTNLINVCDCVY